MCEYSVRAIRNASDAMLYVLGRANEVSESVVWLLILVANARRLEKWMRIAAGSSTHQSDGMD